MGRSLADLTVYTPDDPVCVVDAKDSRVRFFQGNFIARGAFGEVYELEGASDACIKVIRGAEDGVRDEVRGLLLVKRLGSDAVTEGHVLYSDASVCVIAMPRMAGSGDTMFKKLQGYPDRAADALALVLRVARLVRDALEGGVYVNDIKPGNFLFDACGSVKLSDFGSFLPYDGISTPGDENPATYDSPEQVARYHFSRAGIRPHHALGHVEGDLVWSLGVLALHMQRATLQGMEDFYKSFSTTHCATKRRIRDFVTKETGIRGDELCEMSTDDAEIAISEDVEARVASMARKAALRASRLLGGSQSTEYAFGSRVATLTCFIEIVKIELRELGANRLPEGPLLIS